MVDELVPILRKLVQHEQKKKENKKKERKKERPRRKSQQITLVDSALTMKNEARGWDDAPMTCYKRDNDNDFSEEDGEDFNGGDKNMIV